ncbi:hypothetical protein KAFR_0D02010 [Kazachstania africana CBS 2517]|uniref:Uncharacterized protein n=1 Tax=Kazachstania africana (strain ATCC 22294 / BCRC 22015 / CBS 2517 / CECT 1963 / NBRC 1671 / NRRL Y-8276) TaxID=1071382 RepID=H2ATZ8_KAZAF|nr:hypothetical protein KAFR_0D02010 [Kazachstania africana CBS 2517]CCF57848.1 hypothetical protein KAFR_0D02010 [Kazachstania africana CBS 2517]
MGGYYSSFNNTLNDPAAGLPLIFRPLKDVSWLSITMLHNGNLITESRPATKWINGKRQVMIKKYMSIKSLFLEQRARTNQKYEHARGFLMDRIFDNEVENKDYFVPGSILALGSFFLGRIISSKGNYKVRLGKAPSSNLFFSRIITSSPSRVIMPGLLAGLTLYAWIPETTKNFGRIFEGNVLRNRWMGQYVNSWKDKYKKIMPNETFSWVDFRRNRLPSRIRTFRKQLINEFHGSSSY